MVLLTLDTPMEEYIAFITAKCQELNIDTECIVFKEIVELLGQYKSLREFTVDYPDRLAVITLIGWGDSMDQELRSFFINKLKTPMDALHIYLECAFLTDEQDAQLKTTFQGKLPQAEKELKDNIITRKKVL